MTYTIRRIGHNRVHLGQRRQNVAAIPKVKPRPANDDNLSPANDAEDAPWQTLCTAGLVFKLVHGVLKVLRLAGDEPHEPHMERASAWVRERGGDPPGSQGFELVLWAFIVTWSADIGAFFAGVVMPKSPSLRGRASDRVEYVSELVLLKTFQLSLSDGVLRVSVAEAPKRTSSRRAVCARAA